MMILYLQMIEGEQDKSKFEKIYLEYRNLMYYTAYNILKNNEDAEDAVHQAFVSIIENLEKIDEEVCPKTKSYVVIITERKAIDIYRNNAKWTDIDVEDMGICIPLPGDNGLADALARLRPRYREVLLLRFYHGYTTKEIGDLFNMKSGSVNRLISRAKEALATVMEKENE